MMLSLASVILPIEVVSVPESGITEESVWDILLTNPNVVPPNGISMREAWNQLRVLFLFSLIGYIRRQLEPL